MTQLRTPLYDALKKHYQRRPISLHVPGHKNGLLIQSNLFFQHVTDIDVTELTNLDDLHSSSGVILEAETLLAELYEVEKSFFLVNGSTVGNLAMILGTIQPGETVFIQRNCHKSILNGVQLAKANPILLGPTYNAEWGVAEGVPLETVKEAFQQYPQCKAIILTYPNYYGMVNDLQGICKFAHSHGIPVLVDEAHGAHFIGGDYFPPSAVRLGADVIVQSAHKTLPAMTMGSFLHVNSKIISHKIIEHYLKILQSSSPSYPIMASLDIARSYLATYTKEDQLHLMYIIEDFKRKLNQIDGIKVLEYRNGLGDPLKVTIQSTNQATGYELQQLFEEEDIFSELADPYNVLFVLPLLKNGMEYPFERILNGIRKAVGKSLKEGKSKRTNYFQKERISTLQTCHRTQKERTIPLSEAAGYLCAETIIPYPPGVPLLLRGERITDEDLKGLRFLLETGARFQGGEAILENKIKIIDENDC